MLLKNRYQSPRLLSQSFKQLLLKDGSEESVSQQGQRSIMLPTSLGEIHNSPFHLPRRFARPDYIFTSENTSAEPF